MNKPDEIPQELWDQMDHKERECAVNGHTWYYDTCQDCGARQDRAASQRTNIHRPSDEEYRRQKRKLAR